MDVLDPPLITLELTPEGAQLMLDLLFVGGEQNVVFMSNEPSRLRWQLSPVKANDRRIVAIYWQLNEQIVEPLLAARARASAKKRWTASSSTHCCIASLSRSGCRSCSRTSSKPRMRPTSGAPATCSRPAPNAPAPRLASPSCWNWSRPA